MLRICSIATVVLCVARSAVADTYAPSYCEFSISPNVTAERRFVHGEFGKAEVAEYFTGDTFLKAQCSKLLVRQFSKAEIAGYLAHVLKSSGVSSDGLWRTYNTTGGTAVSLKGTKTVQGTAMTAWALGLQGKKSMFFIITGSPTKEFVSDFMWKALQTIKRR